MREINPEIYTHQSANQNWVKGLAQPNYTSIQNLKDFLASHKPGLMLDWGCRTGLFMGAMAKAGYTAMGIDVIPEFVEAGIKKGLNIVIGDVTHTDEYFEPDYFDYVWGNHILEHLDDPKTALANLRKVVKLSGMAVLYFPKEKSLNFKLTKKHRYLFDTGQAVMGAIDCRVWKVKLTTASTNRGGNEWYLELKAI